MFEQIDVEKIRKVAEKYYRDGDFYCSEAVVKTIKDEFQLPISDEIIKAASISCRHGGFRVYLWSYSRWYHGFGFIFWQE